LLVFVAIASSVITHCLGFILNPNTPLLASAWNKILGDSVVRKPLDDSMIRLRKSQRYNLNIYLSTLLVCTALAATVMNIHGPHQQLSTVRTLNLEDAVAQPNSNATGSNTGSHAKWGTESLIGMGKALLLIFFAEIGDKTFFVALILAMKYDRTAVFVGSMAALGFMSLASAGIGWLLIGLVRHGDLVGFLHFQETKEIAHAIVFFYILRTGAGEEAGTP
jgi:hypothetical protein